MKSRYEVQWGTTVTYVSDVDELDRILTGNWRRPGDGGAPFAVFVRDLHRDPDRVSCLPRHIAGGVDPRGHGWVLGDEGVAYRPELDAPDGDESWDWCGRHSDVPAWWLRLTHEDVRALLLGFVTGEEPAGVSWGLEEPPTA